MVSEMLRISEQKETFMITQAGSCPPALSWTQAVPESTPRAAAGTSGGVKWEGAA